MPGERSLYRKIQVALEYAKEGTHDSPQGLEDHIYKRSPTNFAYYWRDEHDKIRHDYSKNSIASTISLCSDLGLISSQSGRLTQIGVSAADPRRFPMIVGNRVAKLLARRGFDLNEILGAIGSLLGSSEPSPPTADAIWKQFGAESTIDLQDFKRLINLLGECKILWMTQKRIYLPLLKSD